MRPFVGIRRMHQWPAPLEPPLLGCSAARERQRRHSRNRALDDGHCWGDLASTLVHCQCSCSAWMTSRRSARGAFAPPNPGCMRE
jgi:hypothetical protein